jgi:hypothetical protein
MQPSTLPKTEAPRTAHTDPPSPSRPPRSKVREAAPILIAIAAAAIVLLAVYAARSSHPLPPTTLPLLAGMVLAFSPGIPGVTSISPQSAGGQAEYLRSFNFTVSQTSGVLVGAWSFDPSSRSVFACAGFRNQTGSWGGMISGCGSGPLHEDVTAGDWVLLFAAFGEGNLTVTQTIEVS